MGCSSFGLADWPIATDTNEICRGAKRRRAISTAYGSNSGSTVMLLGMFTTCNEDVLGAAKVGDLQISAFLLRELEHIGTLSLAPTQDLELHHGS